MIMPTVSLITLGCKLNFAESSTIGRQFADRGYTIVEFGEPADVCVVNTCTVTERADRECRQTVRRALRASPEPVVIVTGCYAQLEPEQIASIDGVDFVLGSREKLRLFDLLPVLDKPRAPRILVSDIAAGDDFGAAASADAGGRTRAFLKVQDGCDYSCSFCTIPRARGVSRSQPVDACVEQARRLAAAGYRELVLTGVNVGDYGRKDGTSLEALLAALERVPGIDRIRISSLEPNLVSDALLDRVGASSRLCRHFHIPLQSGSNEILRRMRRRYTATEYRHLLENIARRLPGCGIGVDVIVGFPGENEEHFDETRSLLQDLPLTYLHVFTYSERPGTPAAGFAAPVPVRTRRERNAVLRILGAKKKEAFHRTLLGRRVSVLCEGSVENGRRFGCTDTYARVALAAGETSENTIVHAEITGSDGEVCSARLTGGGRAA